MTARYNLIVLHSPGRQHISDFTTIQNMMMVRAPDIDMQIVSIGGIVPDNFWSKAATLPTALFSPIALEVETSVRGARLIPVVLSKFQEARVLAKAGLPVPETQLITPETKLDEATWGPYTVIKPNRGYRGRGVRLVRTRDVRWVDTSKLPDGDPRRGKQLLAQRYVDTGPHARCHRVMTVFGRPVYSAVSTAIEKRPDVDLSGSEFIELEVAANSMARKLTLSNDADVIDLAKTVHSKAPHLPVMGIDIIREQDTGRLFVLEINSFGATWHLSSDHGRKMQSEAGLDFYSQFGALNTIADALTEATRKYAQ